MISSLLLTELLTNLLTRPEPQTYWVPISRRNVP